MYILFRRNSQLGQHNQYNEEATGWDGLIAGRGKRFFSSPEFQAGFAVHAATYSMGTGVLSLG
jgi:hypothetical protein